MVFGVRETWGPIPILLPTHLVTSSLGDSLFSGAGGVCEGHQPLRSPHVLLGSVFRKHTCQSVGTLDSNLLESKGRVFSVFAALGTAAPGTQWALSWSCFPRSPVTEIEPLGSQLGRTAGIPIKSYLFTQMSLSKILGGRAGSENASGLD